jgi:hypothetical protein
MSQASLMPVFMRRNARVEAAGLLPPMWTPCTDVVRVFFV